MNLTSPRIMLNNVRLAFPSLFEKATFQGKPTNYSATFLIPKTDKKTMAMLKKEIDALLKKAGFKVPRDRWCLKDGDSENFETYEGYAGHYALRASLDKMPLICDRSATKLTTDTGLIYGGCYVNASIALWVQNHKEFGKRINANLRGVQFFQDGEPFVGSKPAQEDEFEQYDEPQTFENQLEDNEPSEDDEDENWI